MIQVNILEIKTKLSEYLDRAGKGERIIICRHNKPVAELRAIESARAEARPVGPLPGRPRFDVPAAFFEPLSDDALSAWEGMSTESPAFRPISVSRGTTKVAERRSPAEPVRRASSQRRSTARRPR